ncbi:hypothetical protein [Streptomyces sp. NPDC051211]|uniref:hypothetical protein n=1 Tax=Streptomyces sp. NPDC051211 TaxID=3154643 RepID=UPI00345031FB
MTETMGQPDPRGVPPRPAAPPPMPVGLEPVQHGNPPRWAWWVIGIVIPVMGTAVTLLAASGNKEPSPRGAASGPTVAPASTPTPTPSPSPSPSSSIAPLPGPPSASPSAPGSSGPQDLTAPAGYQVHQGRWGIAPPACGESQLVDLDAGVSTTVEVDREDGPTTTQSTGSELEYRPYAFSCLRDGDSASSVELRSFTGRQVGVLKLGQPQSFESCRAAAGTGFGPVRAGGGRWTDRGLVEGAALCAVTDKGSVAMALLEGTGEEPYRPAVSGNLVVWSKG